MNVGNIKRTARRHGIEEPLSHTLEQLLARLKECKEHTKRLMAQSPMAQSPWLRKQFIVAKQQEAMDKNN